jgi:hypothetical protein
VAGRLRRVSLGIGVEYTLHEVATFDFLDLRVDLPVARRSFGDVNFSVLIFLPQFAVGSKGIAKDEVPTQFKAVRWTYIEMM